MCTVPFCLVQLSVHIESRNAQPSMHRLGTSRELVYQHIPYEAAWSSSRNLATSDDSIFSGSGPGMSSFCVKGEECPTDTRLRGWKEKTRKQENSPSLFWRQVLTNLHGSSHISEVDQQMQESSR